MKIIVVILSLICLFASVNSSLAAGSECEVCRVVSDAVERVLVLNQQQQVIPKSSIKIMFILTK